MLSEASVYNNDITKDRVADIWTLAEIHSLYEEKRDWYHKQFLPSLDKEMQGAMDPLELFALYLHIGEMISEISLEDPMLPLSLLPDYWIGRQVISELYRSFQSFTALIPRDSAYFEFLV